MGVAGTAALLALTAFAAPAVRRAAVAVTSPIAAMGGMPLSIYTLHLVVISLAKRTDPATDTVTDDSWPLVLGLIVGSMVFAWLWRRYVGRGPLEWLLRWASGRARSDARPAPEQRSA